MELVNKLLHHKRRGQYMDDEEEVDYKQQLIEKSKSNEKFSSGKKSDNSTNSGVFEGYLLKVIDTSNFI